MKIEDKSYKVGVISGQDSHPEKVLKFNKNAFKSL